MKNWLGWIAATLAVAVVVHVASVMFLPRAIMLRTMGGIVRGAHGANHMVFGARPTAANRGVVRPSPDLLYSSCVYNLQRGGGAVRVRASGMPRTYWSVSVFDADTNNIFVENDRKAGDHVDFLIVAPGFGQGSGLPTVESPTRAGIVLFRTLIDDDKRLPELDAARRHASCEAYRAD
ncbi:MAG: DUF1254 domain-containing protein [Alphaproteobacteria bacterium]|nr:DUF1254 domain-containing protein [Alphaproteobacteria bacterium]MBL7097848.1 DUF1254 domain-containing protein [Alphaproteobacteria bacterium]